jgi:hypothetical protein
LLLATGCGKFKRPATVVQSVYVDCRNGEYPKARRLFVETRRKTSDGSLEAPPGEGMKELCDRMTNSETLDSVEIRGESIQGDNAVVSTDLRFSDGTSKMALQVQLLKEDGAWKIVR